MTFDPNDPRLTAYVLGELDPSERPEIEAMLETSPEGRQAVAEIRQTIGWLTERLRDEQATHAVAAGSDGRPIAVIPPPTPSASSKPWWRRTRARVIGLAALLVLGATVSLVPIALMPRRAPRYGAYRPKVAAASPTATGLGEGRILHSPRMERTRVRAARIVPPPPNESAASPPGLVVAQDQPTGKHSTFAVPTAPGFQSPPAGEPSAYYYLNPAGGAPTQGQAPGRQGQAPGRQGQMIGMGQSIRVMGGQAGQNPREASRPSMGPTDFADGGQRAGNAVMAGDRSLALRQNFNGQPGPGQQAVLGQKLPRLQTANAPQQPPTSSMALAKNKQTSGDSNQAQGQSLVYVPAAAPQDGNPGANQGQVLDAQARSDPQTQSRPAQSADQAGKPTQVLEELETKFNANRVQAEALVPPPAPGPMPQAGEVFLPIVDNPFVSTAVNRQSTFSIDVDTAAYANVRRYLAQDQLPPPDAVRIEELLNYFPYDDAPPPASSPDPFAVHVEVAACPWSAAHRLARVGIAARPIDQSRRPPSNLVFLIDVSGSMDEELPMLQWGLSQLVEQLGENDRVAIVVYASASGLVLPSKSCLHKAEILSKIEQLRAGGSTNGGAGIQLAYQVAAQNFIKNGTNRVIWATDGEFNVGVTGQDELVRLIQEKAKGGVFLTLLGCGTGNIKDGPLEQVADKGNGHYAYIDSPREAYRVLVEQMGSTLVTVAKDVKIQVDFDTASVAQFRLIGYENRVMAHRDFADDSKDAGDIGAGHHVTALYEIAPAPAAAKPEGERRLLTVKLRYKKPDQGVSHLLEFPAKDPGIGFGRASDDLKFAAAVAGFGMLLRGSPYKGTLTYAGVLEIAQPTLALDRAGYRKEFVDLVRRAQALTAPQAR